MIKARIFDSEERDSVWAVYEIEDMLECVGICIYEIRPIWLFVGAVTRAG